MDPATIGLILSLAKEGPDMIAFLENQYQLWASGSLTVDQLQQSYRDAATDVQGAIANWNDSKTAKA